VDIVQQLNPLNLRTDCNSLRGFKTNLKTHLFRHNYF